jgi:hypothetical protein
MYFLIQWLVLQKKIWFHLAQWFQRGLIVKVYSGQRMPSCSNTSHDRYKSGTQLWWRLYHTTEWLFSGNGGDGRELLSPKGGSSRYMTTLNEEYKCCVTYCSPLASVVCTLLDFNLLLWNHLANWNRAWYECSLNGFLQNLCCCFIRGCFHIIYGF